MQLIMPDSQPLSQTPESAHVRRDSNLPSRWIGELCTILQFHEGDYGVLSGRCEPKRRCWQINRFRNARLRLCALVKQKVLLIDLDAQSNSSLILLGGDRWIESQRTSRNVAAYIEDRLYSIEQTKIRDYLVEGIGDIETAPGQLPAMTLLSGSLNFEEMQDELITYYSRNQTPFQQAKLRCAEHFRAAFSFASPLADLVILDCAPGLSNATAAALKLANKVVVPFRPDAVSQFAVDRISQIVEGRKFEDVLAMPPTERRYICLANYVRDGGRDRIYVDTIAGDHPILKSEIPAMPDVADAFDFLGEPQSIEEKYGTAVEPLRALHSELTTILPV